MEDLKSFIKFSNHKAMLIHKRKKECCIQTPSNINSLSLQNLKLQKIAPILSIVKSGGRSIGLIKENMLILYWSSYDLSRIEDLSVQHVGQLLATEKIVQGRLYSFLNLTKDSESSNAQYEKTVTFFQQMLNKISLILKRIYEKYQSRLVNRKDLPITHIKVVDENEAKISAVPDFQLGHSKQSKEQKQNVFLLPTTQKPLPGEAASENFSLIAFPNSSNALCFSKDECKSIISPKDRQGKYCMNRYKNQKKKGGKKNSASQYMSPIDFNFYQKEQKLCEAEGENYSFSFQIKKKEILFLNRKKHKNAAFNLKDSMKRPTKFKPKKRVSAKIQDEENNNQQRTFKEVPTSNYKMGNLKKLSSISVAAGGTDEKVKSRKNYSKINIQSNNRFEQLSVAAEQAEESSESSHSISSQFLEGRHHFSSDMCSNLAEAFIKRKFYPKQDCSINIGSKLGSEEYDGHFKRKRNRNSIHKKEEFNEKARKMSTTFNNESKDKRSRLSIYKLEDQGRQGEGRRDSVWKQKKTHKKAGFKRINTKTSSEMNENNEQRNSLDQIQENNRELKAIDVTEEEKGREEEIRKEKRKYILNKINGLRGQFQDYYQKGIDVEGKSTMCSIFWRAKKKLSEQSEEIDVMSHRMKKPKYLSTTYSSVHWTNNQSNRQDSWELDFTKTLCCNANKLGQKFPL